MDVTAFDISEAGKKKAIELAKSRNVSINYVTGTIDELNLQDNWFDNIGLVYAHFSASQRSQYHKQLPKTLKQGGIIVLEGFSKKNLIQKEKYPEIGGPPNIDMLFSVDEIKEDFNNFNIIMLKEEVIPLNEGLHHKGMGSVIRFIGKKL